MGGVRLAEAGVPSTILELGKPVQPRRKDLAQPQSRRARDPRSNYCFGEGGAGTYSDGKLYTRAKDRDRRGGGARRSGALRRAARDRDRGAAARRLEPPAAGAAIACARTWPAWASPTGSRPSATGLRTERGKRAGRDGRRRRRDRRRRRRAGRRAFGASRLRVGGRCRARARCASRSPWACGSSTRSTLIDQIQYGPAADVPRLPAAFYELTAQCGGRSMYSFCMCPGGSIVPLLATEPDGVVVNGMSLSRRNSPYANAGLVVSVDLGDLRSDAAGPLAGVGASARNAAGRVHRRRWPPSAPPPSDTAIFLAGRPSDRRRGPPAIAPG